MPEQARKDAVMCLARVYVNQKDGSSGREAILTDVTWIEVQHDRLVLRDLLGKEKVFQGRIAAVDFVSGVVTLTRSDE